MDNYIIKEGDVLGNHDGHRPIVIRRITATHVTFARRGVEGEHTLTRERFEYALWYGSFFMLEHAS